MGDITFQAFQQKAAEITHAQQGDTQALEVTQEGKLGTHAVRLQPSSPEDKVRFAKVKEALANALTREFGLKDAEGLPEEIKTSLGILDTAGEVIAKDIQQIGRLVEAEHVARATVNTELFERAAAVGDKITAKLEALVGKGATLPTRSPLGKLLNDTYADFVDNCMAGPAHHVLEHLDSLGAQLEAKLNAAIDAAFGDAEKPGPLATQLRETLAGTEGAAPADRDAALARTIVDFVPEGGEPLAPPPEKLGTGEPVDPPATGVPLFKDAEVQPPAVANEASTVRADLVREAESGKAWFEAELRQLTGEADFKLKIPRQSPLAEAMLSILQAAKTVGDVRTAFREFFVASFAMPAPNEELSLADTIRTECGNVRSMGAKRLVVHDALLRYGLTDRGGATEVAALGSTIRLALNDFPVRAARNAAANREAEVDGDDAFTFELDELPEPMANSQETREQIEFVSRNAHGDVETLRELVAALKEDDLNYVKFLADKLGFEHVPTAAEMGQDMQGYNSSALLGMMASEGSPLVDNDDFNLYLRQSLGEAPIGFRDGRLVFRPGNWNARPDYVRALFNTFKSHNLDITMHTGRSLNEYLVQSGHDVLAEPAHPTHDLAAFKHAFGLTGKGAFKTSVARTKGQLYLDANGVLKSANRHFGSTVPSTGEGNWQVRAELLAAFRGAGADERFLAKAARKLDLDNENCMQPLARQTAKALILQFEKTGGKIPAPKVNPPKAEPPKVEPPKVEPPKVESPKLTGSGGALAPANNAKIKPQPVEPPKVNPPKAEALQPSSVAVAHRDEERGTERQVVTILDRLALLKNPLDGAKPLPFETLKNRALERAQAAGRTKPAVIDYLRACRGFRLNPQDFSALKGGQDLARTFNGPRGNGVPYALAANLNSRMGEIIPDWAVREGRLAVLQDALDDALASADGRNPDFALERAATKIASALLGDKIPGETVPKICAALAESLLGLRQSMPILPLYDEAMIRNGGGLVRSDSWSFKEGDRSYISNFVPQADINAQYKVDVSKRPVPLTGLARTELLDDSRDDHPVLLRMLRFGEVGTVDVLAGKLRPVEVRRAQYRNLVEQTFLANPALLEKATDGATVDVPVVRLDLGGREYLQADPAKGLAPFEFTFTAPGENAPRKVTLRPQIAHFCLPNDTLKVSGNDVMLFSDQEVANNAAAWAMLKEKARTYAGPHAHTVKTLVAQIDVFMRDLGFARGNNPRPWANFGADMTRLGARIGVLASLLGDVPSVNCNWGRDRTGAMDNECKLVMHKVLTGQPIGDIHYQNPKTVDPDRALRTRMIVETGNWDLAHQVNGTSHELNLHQYHSTVSSGDVKLTSPFGTSGLPGLFDEKNIGRPSALSDREIARQVLNRPNAQIVNNAGGGSCFFYAALRNITGRGVPDDRDKALKLRLDLIEHSKKRLANLKAMKGLREEQVEVTDRDGSRRTVTTLKAQTSAGWQEITLGAKLVNDESFAEYASNADVSHGAFLADMLKRPVTIVTAKQQSSITFNRDLETNEVLTGDPIVIYYNRGETGFGHFQAVM